MRLPTFEVSGMRLLKRVTMIAENNTVIKCIILFFQVTQALLGSLNNCHVKNNC